MLLISHHQKYLQVFIFKLFSIRNKIITEANLIKFLINKGVLSFHIPFITDNFSNFILSSLLQIVLSIQANMFKFIMNSQKLSANKISFLSHVWTIKFLSFKMLPDFHRWWSCPMIDLFWLNDCEKVSFNCINSCVINMTSLVSSLIKGSDLYESLFPLKGKKNSKI